MRILYIIVLACTALVLGYSVLAGLNPSPTASRQDQCLRHEFFIECMKSTAPASINSQTILQCRDEAYYESWRQLSTIKTECRG